MKVNFNSSNYLNNTSFKSKFTENSKKVLYNAANNIPFDVYATLQMAKNDKKNNVFLLRKSSTYRYGYDILSFKFDKKEKKYDCDDIAVADDTLLSALYWLKTNGSIFEPREIANKRNKEAEKLYNKYAKELIDATNYTELTKQIEETENQLKEIEDKLRELKIERKRNLGNYVKKVIDEEATITGEKFNSYQWREEHEPQDYGM